MDLTKITMKEIDGHLTELGVIDSKDFVIKALSENIAEIQKKFNKIEEENQDLKLMVTDFKKKIEESRKRDEKFLEIKKTQKYQMQETSHIGYSFFAEENSKEDFLFSDSNKYVKRICSKGPGGLLCHSIEKKSDKLIFTIKIVYTRRSNIIMGFCSNKGELQHCHINPCSLMLHLKNGSFYKRSESHSFITIKANRNEIYSAILDIELRTIEFRLNGLRLAAPIPIDLSDQEIDSMCPGIDIFDQGDAFRIID